MKMSCGIGGFETVNAILMRCPTCHYKLRDSINNRNKWRHSRTHTETEAQPNVAVKRPHDILFLARQVWCFICLSLSGCVWPCGRLISINVETENRKLKIEFEWGHNKSKSKCAEVFPQLGIVSWAHFWHTSSEDFTILRHIALYIIGEVDNISRRHRALGYLRAKFGE